MRVHGHWGLSTLQLAQYNWETARGREKASEVAPQREEVPPFRGRCCALGALHMWQLYLSKGLSKGALVNDALVNVPGASEIIGDCTAIRNFFSMEDATWHLVRHVALTVVHCMAVPHSSTTQQYYF